MSAGRVEYCRPDDVKMIFGLSRSKVFELLRAGKLRSVLRDGLRLIECESIREWIRRGAASEECRVQSEEFAGASVPKQNNRTLGIESKGRDRQLDPEAPARPLTILERAERSLRILPNERLAKDL